MVSSSKTTQTTRTNHLILNKDMTRKKSIKLLENLGNALNKEKDLEEAASIIYILAGTVALKNKEALSSLCMHNVVWANEALKAVQRGQEEEKKSKIILPNEE